MNKNDNKSFNEDFILKKIAISIAEKDNIFFDELEKDDTIINPNQDELDNRILNMINENFDYKKKKTAKLKKLKKLMLKVAVFAIIISTSFIVPFLTVDAFREKVLNFYIENLDTHSSFTPTEENASGSIDIKYLPDGYKLSDEYKTSKSISYTYFNYNNKMIDITLYNHDTTFSIDTEDSKKYNININLDNGYIYRKTESVTLIFKFHSNTIVINSNDNLSNEELIKIANKIN